MKWVNWADVRFLNRNALRIMGWKSGSRTRLFSSLIVGSSWSEFRLEEDEDGGRDEEDDDILLSRVFSKRLEGFEGWINEGNYRSEVFFQS